MKVSRLCAAAIISIALALATSAQAAVMQVSLASRTTDFDPVFTFFYPDLVSGEADLWADFRYDTDTWEASGLVSIGGYTDSFLGMAAISDNTGALLTSMPSADPSAFGVFGIWFDGSNGDGSHFSLNMSATQDTSASFSVPGTFSVAPYGYVTFGSTTGDTSPSDCQPTWRRPRSPPRCRCSASLWLVSDWAAMPPGAAAASRSERPPDCALPQQEHLARCSVRQ